MLISISAVSSADNNTIIISKNNNVNDNILSINDLNNETLSETGDGSFAELNNTVNGGTSNSINLTRDYAYSGSDTIKDGILINTDNLVIDGQGHTIDAKGQSRIFYVNSTTVTLKNIIFINGNAFDKSGGAIYGYGDNLRVINCTFINNNASWGGAIFSYPDSYSVFARSTFINNTAKYGGALVTYYGMRQDVLYCNFTSNYASSSGGAFLMRGQLSYENRPYSDYVNIIGCYFVGNQAPEGSAITNDLCPIINLTDSIILGDDLENLVYSWGRMFTADNNWWGTTAEDKSFRPNVTSDIYVNTWLYFDLTINLESSSAAVSINNLYDGQTGKTSTYSTNKLPSVDVEFTTVNGTLDFNTVNLGSSGAASVNYNVLGDCTITANCEDRIISKKFKSGSFAELQALIDNSDDDVIVLEKDYIYTIGIDKSSTGIRIEKSNIVIDGNGHIINAGNKSRVMDIYARNVTLINVVITGGNVYDIAGAGVKAVGIDINFINCTFMNNYADDGNGGSAIYVGSKGTLISDCRFINNAQTYTSGGAVYCSQNNITIINSLFEGNRANSRGGAVYVTKGDTSIINCTFKNNTANEAGAIYDFNFDDEPTIITDCSFINNVATSEDSTYGGGAICARSSTISNSLFNGNRAISGAAIYSMYTDNIIEKCIFINNTADKNGIIFFEEGSSVVDSIFLNNNLMIGGNIIVNIFGGAKANYNWYGNVWKNYNRIPNVSNLAEMSNWLFLNLTDIVYDGDNETFSCKFNFLLYDNDNGQIAPYDFHNLGLFDLELSSQNLTLNKNSVALGETIVGNVTYYKGNLIAQYEDVVYEMSFKFKKETWIEANSTINVVLNKYVYIHELVHPFEQDYMPFLRSAQRVRYAVADESIAKVDTKGKITGLKVGVTNITITFNGCDVMGNDKYEPSSITITVNVTRIPTQIKAIYEAPEVICVGDTESFIYSLNPSGAGSIEYICNDTSVAEVGYNYIKAIKEGTVNITAVYRKCKICPFKYFICCSGF